MQARQEPTRIETLVGRHSKDLLANIRLGQKRLTSTNTLAYKDTQLIIALDSFIVKQFASNKSSLLLKINFQNTQTLQLI